MRSKRAVSLSLMGISVSEMEFSLVISSLVISSLVSGLGFRAQFLGFRV